jgi:hypothetical protein
MIIILMRQKEKGMMKNVKMTSKSMRKRNTCTSNNGYEYEDKKKNVKRVRAG